MRVRQLGFVLPLAVLLPSSTAAWAQGPAPAPTDTAGTSPPPATGTAGVTVTSPPPSGTAQRGAAQPGTAQPERRLGVPPEPKERARFRWGLSFFGGPYFFNGSMGGVGGASVRAGAQITNLFGVYAQPVALLGGGASVSSTNTSASALVLGGIGVLGDITLGNVFFVGGGPEFLGGVAGSSSAGTSGTAVNASEGVFFGLTARLGFALGHVEPHRRRCFTIGGDFHLVITPGGPVIVPLVAMGYDFF